MAVERTEPAEAATLSCFKPLEQIEGERIALLVAHAPAGRVKPNVPIYSNALRRAGLKVVLIVASDQPFVADAAWTATLAGGFVRDNKGYDFAAWAHALKVAPELWRAEMLFLLNDSVIGPLSQKRLDHLLRAVEESPADVVGATDCRIYEWHLQSYFLAFKSRALANDALRSFFDQVQTLADKQAVIRNYEVPLARVLAKGGLTCAAIYRCPDDKNPAVFHWRALIEHGFPFVKTQVLRGIIPDLDINGWRDTLIAAGFEPLVAAATVAASQPTPTGPNSGRIGKDSPVAFPSPSERTPAEILRACLSPASFWWPQRTGPLSAWLEHGPFAFWIIEALRPHVVAELGTHGGYSYFTFCQAVQQLRLDTRCYAVDHWKGDEHAGYYGEDIYRDVRSYHDPLYSAFSTLIRSTFDEALRHFDDGTVDLLHIDGCHEYQQVRNDFESWLPKLSDKGVVLFHDTNVRCRNFGVFRLWDELRLVYPHFEFLHGYGLGVLGVGDKLPPDVRELFAATQSEQATAHVREAYSRLGSAISKHVTFLQQNSKVEQQSAELETLRAEAGKRSAEADGLRATLEMRAAETSAVRRDLEAMKASNSWRLTAPLRRVMQTFRDARRSIQRQD